MLLAGDIGGTKAALAIVDPAGDPRAFLAEAQLPTAEYASAVELLGSFVGQVPYSIDRISLGVCGPIVDGRVAATNLPWFVDERELVEHMGVRNVLLLNDLESIAYAVPELSPSDLATLNEGQPRRGGSLAVVAPGTGLGEAFLTWDGAAYRAYPSEGGHSDFAPNNALQVELVRSLLARHGHVSYERVCSGRGIPNLYAFLKESGAYPEPQWLADALAAVDDPTPVIVNHAQGDDADPLCRATLELFIDILGAEAGNLAMKVLATGGVYLGGGIPPRILPALQSGRLMKAFLSKGRLSPIMPLMPVHVILNPKAGLLGAIYRGLREG